MYNFYDAGPAAHTAVLQNTQSKVNQQTQTVRYECTKCESIFTTRLYLHHHEATAHNRVFHCPFCESLFSNKTDYATHVNAHTEKRLLHCAFCKKVFSDVDEYTIHTKLHTEPFMYKCDKCSAMFSQLSKLRTHSATHVNRKFIHTIPKFSQKRRIVCPCINPSENNASNPAENTGRNPITSATSVTTAHQTEASSSPPPCELEDTEPDTAQEPEAGCSRSLGSKENSPEKSSSSSNRKRKKKDKGERRLKKTEAAKSSAQTESQTLSVDDTERMSPVVLQIPSTSEHRRVTRQRLRLLRNKKATERITETDCRELPEDDTEATTATEKLIPSNSALGNTARKRDTGRPRKKKRAETQTEIEETDAEIRSTTKESEEIEKKRGRTRKNENKSTQIERVLRSHLQKYQNAEMVTETEAGESLDGIEIIPAPEKQISLSAQEIHSSEVRDTDAGITSATRKPVSLTGKSILSTRKPVLSTRKPVLSTRKRILSTRKPVSSQSENKEMGKKRGRPLRNKTESTQLRRGLDRLQKHQHAEMVTETEAGGSSDNIEITSAPEKQISSSSQEILSSGDQETDARIIYATKKRVSSRSENEKMGKKRGRLLKNKTKKIAETDAGKSSIDQQELNPASVEPISTAIEEIIATFEQSRDEVNSAIERHPLSSLKDQNVAHKIDGGHSAKAPEQTSETNSSQPRNENSEEMPIVDESIPLSCQEQIQAQENLSTIIDLTSSPEHGPEANADGIFIPTGGTTFLQRKKLFPAKKLENVRKLQSHSSNKQLGQKASAPSVSVVRSVSGPLTKIQFVPSTQNNAPISRVTVLKPVTLSKTSVEPSRATEVTSSGSQTSTANRAERMPLKRRPVYESFFSNGGENTESTDTAAKSSTEKEPEIDSVYTFEEENVNKKTTSGPESSSPNKRRRSELWRFFLTESTSPKKKAKTARYPKRRKSIHFYQCTRCIRVFPNGHLLSKHELVHSQNRGVACNLCGGVFGNVGNLILHKKLTHNPSF